MAEEKKRESRKRNYIFVIHVKPDVPYEMENMVSEWLREEGCPIKYLVIQLEETKAHGLHYQGYVEFSEGQTMKQVKTLFKRNDVHLEPRAGSAQQAADYCKKEESRVKGPWEWGEMSQQGKRTDIHDAVDKIKKGVPLKQVAEEHSVTFVRCHKGFQALDAMINPAPERGHDNMRLIIWCGLPGCGKTWYVRDRYRDAYSAMDTSNGWFDGYSGQQTIVFDEFTGQFPLQLLFKLIDGQPMQLQVKGGFVKIRATTIIILSNLHLDTLYAGNPNRDAFERRIQEFSIRYNTCWVHGTEPPSHPLKEYRQRQEELKALQAGEQVDEEPMPEEQEEEPEPRPRLKRSHASIVGRVMPEPRAFPRCRICTQFPSDCFCDRLRCGDCKLKAKGPMPCTCDDPVFIRED